MDTIASDLAHFLVQKLSATSPDGRFLVGVSGIPASGKSCLARSIVEKCNRLLVASMDNPEPAILVGLDGWHLTRDQLAAMPDPQEARDRRGAHWTYDAEGYAAFVSSLRIPLSNLAHDPELTVIKAPTFDHAKKDPLFDALSIFPHHRLIVIEGQFTFISYGAWKSAGEALDERWYLELNENEATRRILKRHVATGVAENEADARWRAENNDMPNGRFMIENMLEPTRTIASVDDPSFVLDATEKEPKTL